MNSLFPFSFPFQCSKNDLFGIQAPAMATSGRFIFSRLKKEHFFVKGAQLLGVSVALFSRRLFTGYLSLPAISS